MDAGSFVTLSATKSQSQFLQHRNSRKITWERTLDVPDLAYDFYLNLLDWGSSNVLAIALGLTVYQWDATDCITSELVTVDEESGPVTSVKWAPDGRHISVGLNNGDVQLWDSTANRLLRTLRGGHQSRVGALDWNSHVLTTGGMDGLIVNNDVRISSPIVEIYSGHHREVCGLKWSASGQQLASGGNDHLLHIWDRSMASINAPTQYLYRLEYHTAAVKALAWCPFQANLLASGGGGGDNCINFWNTHTGAGLISVDTGSQVSALLWSKNERELLSSHGFTRKQMTLWKYPSMAKMAEITGHTSGVLFMAQSPDGCTVAVAAGDETLRYWNIFGSPETFSTYMYGGKRLAGLFTRSLEEGAFDADKVYMAAIDKFGDMMFKSNAHTPDDEPWHYNNGSCLRTRNFREKDKLLSQAKRLHEDALIMDSNNFQVKEALSKCDLN